jgi:hypothetical protein
MPSIEVIESVKRVTAEINVQIQSCNKPADKSDKSNFRFFETMAYMSQNAVDDILANTDCSYLERILLSSEKITQYEAGNCQLQTFVALDRLITEFLTSKLSTYEKCIPISICTTNNHAFIIVDKTLVCDPWSNYVGSIGGSPINLSKHKEIFGIRSNWDCFDNGSFDSHSTAFTESLVEQLLMLEEYESDEESNSFGESSRCDELADCDEIVEDESCGFTRR